MHLTSTLRCGSTNLPMQSGIENSIITLPPTALCTPEVGAAQFAGLQQLALSSGSNASDVYTNATSAYFADFAAPVPVLSAVTKVSSESFYF